MRKKIRMIQKVKDMASFGTGIAIDKISDDMQWLAFNLCQNFSIKQIYCTATGQTVTTPRSHRRHIYE